MFGSDRARMRAVFHGAWKKKREGEPLEPLEYLLCSVIDMHPEYHGLFEDDDGLDRDFDRTNPYLHLGMHVALHEQIQADRPPGVRRAYQRITRRIKDVHEAEHAILECLRDVLVEAQMKGRGVEALDEHDYLKRLGALAKRR